MAALIWPPIWRADLMAASELLDLLWPVLVRRSDKPAADQRPPRERQLRHGLPWTNVCMHSSNSYFLQLMMSVGPLCTWCIARPSVQASDLMLAAFLPYYYRYRYRGSRSEPVTTGPIRSPPHPVTEGGLGYL